MLGGRELENDMRTHRTWLGISKDGNIATEIKVPHPLLVDDCKKPVQMINGTHPFIALGTYRTTYDKSYVLSTRGKILDRKPDIPKDSTNRQTRYNMTANDNVKETVMANHNDANSKASKVADPSEDGEKGGINFYSISGSMKLCAGLGTSEYTQSDPRNLDVSNSLGLNVENFKNKDETVLVGGRRNETYGLTNVDYVKGESWPKAERGKRLLAEALQASHVAKESKEQLIERLFNDVLSNTAQDIKPKNDREPWKRYLERILKENIFIPRLGGSNEQRQKVESEEHKNHGAGNCNGISSFGAGTGSAAMTSSPPLPNPNSHFIVTMNNTKATKAAPAFISDNYAAPVSTSMPTPTPKSAADSLATQFYGTTQQSIILMSSDKEVTFVERTLYDANGCRKPLSSQGRDRRFDYHIQERPRTGADDQEAKNRLCCDFTKFLDSMGSLVLAIIGF